VAGARPATANAELEAAQARVLADPELQPEALANALSARAATQPVTAGGTGRGAGKSGTSAATANLLEGTPRDELTRLLLSLEEQSQQMVAQDDPGALGPAGPRPRPGVAGQRPADPRSSTLQQHKSRLNKALEGAAAKLAEEWDQRLMETVNGLAEHPGRRLAAAEAP